MTEIKVGAWNALNAFGDSRSAAAMEVVKRLDADVLFVSETTLLEDENSEYFLEATEEMKSLGYEDNMVSGYSDDSEIRNKHTMSMWNRLGVNGPSQISRAKFGNRYGLDTAEVTSGLRVVGVHLDDNNKDSRNQAAKDLITRYAGSGGKITEPTIVMGDFNSLPTRNRGTGLLRLLGRIIPEVEFDYYDDSLRLQRLAGKIIRICDMANPEAMRTLESAGLKDADSNRQPTVGKNPLSFQLDHIMGSSDLVLNDFTVHSAKTKGSVKPLSDHCPITVKAQI